MLLWWVALSGLMLAALGQQWRFERQREKEAEMVARAEEIRTAIAAYHQASSAGPQRWPLRLSDLVEDRRGPKVLRHLRRVWVDPLTGQPVWGLLRAQADQADAGIQGVYSLAKARPIRPPTGVDDYASWHFAAEPAAPTGQAAASQPDAP
jgi:type II secretory pathway pseudopilin PulG